MIDEAMLRTVATYVLYATAGFLFLPAGRDIVSHKTCILPGEGGTKRERENEGVLLPKPTPTSPSR